MKTTQLLIILAISTAFGTSASAATSQYTDLDLTKCKLVGPLHQEDGGGTWECKGLKGNKVVYSEGDLRGAVSFGARADKQCAASQSFGHFNSPGKTIEWRINNGKPYATILRWFTDNGEEGGKQNWLVITKLSSDEVCRTAIVDAQYPDANEVARQKADQSAGFNCPNDLPELISDKALKVEEVMSGVPCSPP